ncbi:MAG: sensor histidine kinase [Hydrococcus sp. Prado102]|jgi:signal transduction histidine kinase|nr:sensor histidine kinase [Hydrococcus sp. Prado102]
MTKTNSLFASLRQTVRYVEWIVLLASLLSGLLSDYFQKHPQLLPFFCAYVGIFFGLSGYFPVARPLWQRRLYVGVELLLILLALAMRLWFDLLMYFILAKSCFLLRWREVVIAAISLGIGNTAISAWILPQRIAEVVERIQAGITVYHVPTILLVNAVNYAGSSLVAIWFGVVLVAERKSRQKAEVLAQQVELQTATLERTRIARDIHDSLGHSLTALDVQLELSQRLFQNNPTASQEAVAIAHQLAKQCLQDVRRSVQMLRHDEFDLNRALTNLTDRIRQDRSVEILCNLKLPELTTQQSHQLYCIIQEGLTNVQKHARATQVNLSGYTTPTAIEIELRDNGIGFNPNITRAGFGLLGMRERVQLLDGQFKIQSAVGQGTSIQITIPLS